MLGNQQNAFARGINLKTRYEAPHTSASRFHSAGFVLHLHFPRQKRSTKRRPDALWQPKQHFRRYTAKRCTRKPWWIIGPTPFFGDEA
jgi:hypothetical protein